MDILTSSSDGILTLTFNRPEKKNALTAAMYTTLTDALQEADRDPAIRAVLLTGHAAIFTSGNDVEDFLHNPPTSENSPVFRFLSQLNHTQKPMIAAVAGPAVGIGTTMLLHCELVYAADNARFAMPFAQLGLCPEAASSLLLPRLAGYQRAAEKLLLGEPFDAAEAQQMGLVNRVAPVADLLTVARTQALKLAALPPASIRITKALMKREIQDQVDARVQTENAHFAAMLQAPEAKEAFAAFLTKRKPDFSQFQ